MKDIRHRTRFQLPGLLAALLLFSGWPATAGESPRVLASYRSTVTEAELEDWLEFRREAASVDRELALRDLVLTLSLASEAVRLGLDRRPEVRIELERKRTALATAALRRDVNESIAIDDEQAEAKYQEIKDTYTHPRRVRLYNLFKRYPLDATGADKQAVLEKMERLRQRLLAGEDFGQLAEQESDSQTRFQKGLLGNVPAGTFPPEVDRVAMALEAGEISEILQGKDGLTILYCEKILDKVVRSPENLRQIARNLLEKRAYKSAWAELEAALSAAAAPSYHWQVLDAEPPDPGATLVEHAGGRLSVAEATALLSTRAAADPTQLSREQVRQRIDKHLLASMSLQEADRRGLTERDDLTKKRLWSRRLVLASHARIHLVGEQLETPVEDDVRQYYEAHRDDFSRPAVYDLAAIQLPLEKAGDLESHRHGELVVHRIRSGETSFEDAARRHSQHPTAAGGGRLGPTSRWVLPHRFGFNVLRAVMRLQAGEVSDLVVEGGSLWILRLDGVEEARPMTWDEARTGAENKLMTQRARALEAQVLDEWMAELEIAASP